MDIPMDIADAALDERGLLDDVPGLLVEDLGLLVDVPGLLPPADPAVEGRLATEMKHGFFSN